MPSPAPDCCYLYLLRHAATANNLAKPPRLQGRRTNPELSEVGRRQARAAAQFLADRPIGAVYSSPLLRARETALEIAVPHEATVTVVEALTEVDVGQWEGRSWDDIADSEPEAYRRFMDDPAAHSYVGGESLQEVYERVQPAVDRILRDNVGKHIAVAGHNVVNRVILAPLLHLPLSKARTIRQDNCGINVIRFRDGHSQLITLNAAFHLA